LLKLLNIGGVHTENAVYYERKTTNSFEATNTTEAGLLVTGFGIENI